MDILNNRLKKRELLLQLWRALEGWRRITGLTSALKASANELIAYQYLFDPKTVGGFIFEDQFIQTLRTDQSLRIVDGIQQLAELINQLDRHLSSLRGCQEKLLEVVDALQRKTISQSNLTRAAIRDTKAGTPGTTDPLVHDYVCKTLRWTELNERLPRIIAAYDRDLDLRKRLLEAFPFIPVNDRHEVEMFVEVWNSSPCLYFVEEDICQFRDAVRAAVESIIAG